MERDSPGPCDTELSVCSPELQYRALVSGTGGKKRGGCSSDSLLQISHLFFLHFGSYRLISIANKNRKASSFWLISISDHSGDGLRGTSLSEMARNVSRYSAKTENLKGPAFSFRFKKTFPSKRRVSL